MDQNFFKQMVVDLTQTGCAHRTAKLVEHPHIGNRKPIWQIGKAAPLLLLGQGTNQGVEAKGARQQNQQVHTPELSGAETQSSTFALLSREMLVNELIGHMRRENTQ